MCIIYATENSKKIGIKNRYLSIEREDGDVQQVPIETVESIQVFGDTQLSTQCIRTCIHKGIRIGFFNYNGYLSGTIQSSVCSDPSIQRKQAVIGVSEFSLKLAKKIIKAKIHNQWVYLNRMSRNYHIDNSSNLNSLKTAEKKIENAEDIAKILGYEGMAAHSYFQGLSNLTKEDFKFGNRSKRPPKDEFNAMLSYGYSILENEIIGIIVSKGLNPYFGFLHKDFRNHPALASDLIEEWRVVLIDSLVLSLINGCEIKKEHFIMDGRRKGCFLTTEGKAIFFRKLEVKLRTKTKYLEDSFSMNARQAIEYQVGKLKIALSENEVNLYIPLMIR